MRICDCYHLDVTGISQSIGHIDLISSTEEAIDKFHDMAMTCQKVIKHIAHSFSLSQLQGCTHYRKFKEDGGIF